MKLKKIMLAVALASSFGANAAESSTVGNYDFAFQVSGDKAYQPSQVFTDGKKTWIQPKRPGEMPSIFSESGPVKFRTDSPYLIIDSLFPAVTLRYQGEHQVDVDYVGRYALPGAAGVSYGVAQPKAVNGTVAVVRSAESIQAERKQAAVNAAREAADFSGDFVVTQKPAPAQDGPGVPSIKSDETANQGSIKVMTAEPAKNDPVAVNQEASPVIAFNLPAKAGTPAGGGDPFAAKPDDIFVYKNGRLSDADVEACLKHLAQGGRIVIEATSGSERHAWRLNATNRRIRLAFEAIVAAGGDGDRIIHDRVKSYPRKRPLDRPGTHVRFI